MDIEYKGSNCVVISTKHTTIVVDPRLSLVGLKDYSGKYDVELATQSEFAVRKEDSLVIELPGEYEVGNLTIRGIAARRNIDTPEEGNKSTIYKVESNGISVGILGHIAGELSEVQLEALGMLDVLIVPVGNNGYTLDAHGAVHVVRQSDPKIVIPTHYADKELKYEVPQSELEEFLKEIGGSHETVSKLKLKTGTLPETLKVYELTRTS